MLSTSQYAESLHQERLTSRENWRWDEAGCTSPKQTMAALRNRNHWASIARSFYRPADESFIELGCAPGDTSALLTFRTDLKAYGVDFSHDSATYLRTMQRMDKAATLYAEDVFKFCPQRRFDIVASCGLIEHFRGSSLAELLCKHDELLNPGGLLVIEIPNMTGFQYLWHYLFDKPQLDLHNVDSMQPATFSLFAEIGYKVEYSDYVGQCQLWGTSRFKKCGEPTILSRMAAAINVSLTRLLAIVERVSIKVRGPAFSPVFLFVARKPQLCTATHHKS